MPRISTDNYDTVASWNGSQDLFVVEQPDGTKVATPAQVKQYILGDMDEVPTQNSNNPVKSGGIFSTMAVPKYDAANRREYYEGGSAFSGNIDSSPTAGSNNAVSSGGTKTYVDNAVSDKVEYYRSSSANETQSINIGANTEQVNRIFLLSAGYTTRYVLGLVILEYDGKISYVNISNSSLTVSSVSFSSNVVTVIFNTNPWTKVRLTRLC